MADAIRVRAFVADMPDMTPEQLASAYAWASKKKEFEKWSIQASDGGYLLATLCQDEKSVRQWQSLVRTNLQHWVVTLPNTPQKRWLRALSADQYDEAIVSATAGACGEGGEGGLRDESSGSAAVIDGGDSGSVGSDGMDKSESMVDDESKEVTLSSTVTTPLDPLAKRLAVHQPNEYDIINNVDLEPTVGHPQTYGLLELPRNLLKDNGRLFALQHKHITAR